VSSPVSAEQLTTVSQTVLQQRSSASRSWFRHWEVVVVAVVVKVTVVIVVTDPVIVTVETVAVLIGVIVVVVVVVWSFIHSA